MKPQIIDNALKSEDFQRIQETLMGDMFPWYWIDYIAGTIPSENTKSRQDCYTKQTPKTPEDGDNYYFIHQFYNLILYQENAIDESTLRLYPEMKAFIDLINPKQLLRIKANLFLKTDEVIHYDNHTDFEFEHKGAILYINTNNGLTVLEDGTEIKSVANRLLLFDPTKPHHSTNCSDQKRRVNINMNYK